MENQLHFFYTRILVKDMACSFFTISYSNFTPITMLKDCPNMKGRPSRLNMRLWVLSLVEGWHMFYETIFFVPKCHFLLWRLGQQTWSYSISGNSFKPLRNSYIGLFLQLLIRNWFFFRIFRGGLHFRSFHKKRNSKAV